MLKCIDSLKMENKMKKSCTHTHTQKESERHKPHTYAHLLYTSIIVHFTKPQTCNCVIGGQIENFHYIDCSINVTHISLCDCIGIGDEYKKMKHYRELIHRHTHSLNFNADWSAKLSPPPHFSLTNRLLNKIK